MFHIFDIDRSSCSQMFFKIAVLKNFRIFTGKLCRNIHLPWSVFTIFSVNIAKILRTTFFIKHLRWLLLYLNKAFICLIWNVWAITSCHWSFPIQSENIVSKCFQRDTKRNQWHKIDYTFFYVSNSFFLVRSFVA